MTQVRQTRQTTEWPVPDGRHEVRRETGWPLFASAILMLAGAFQFIAGLTALLRRSYFDVGTSRLLVHVGYTPWGWTHIGIGGALFLLGLCVLLRQRWARPLGTAVAVLSAVVMLGFLRAFPTWVFLTIELDGIAIYALSAHWFDWPGRAGGRGRGARTTSHEAVTQGTSAPAQPVGSGSRVGDSQQNQINPGVSGSRMPDGEDAEQVRAAAERQRGQR